LIGVYHTAHLALWAFKNYPGSDVSWSKHVVFVASMAAYTSITLVMDYSSSKWGVRGLFRALREVPGVLGEGNPAVRFNLIAPTLVRTPLTAKVIDRVEKAGATVAEPSDAAWVVMRMCADQNVISKG
jgi:5'-hydroxyaverantin dehydrogenase